jgi:hypothetical protein
MRKREKETHKKETKLAPETSSDLIKTYHHSTIRGKIIEPYFLSFEMRILLIAVVFTNRWIF